MFRGHSRTREALPSRVPRGTAADGALPSCCPCLDLIFRPL
jgi:hypothetical protein